MSVFLVPIIAMVCIPIILIGRPLAQALAAKMSQQNGRGSVPPEVAARLERMEHALDSIAIEVERISENQRFTTKLLSERPSSELSAGERPR
jgi:hypothetical protein